MDKYVRRMKMVPTEGEWWWWWRWWLWLTYTGGERSSLLILSRWHPLGAAEKEQSWEKWELLGEPSTLLIFYTTISSTAAHPSQHCMYTIKYSIEKSGSFWEQDARCLLSFGFWENAWCLLSVNFHSVTNMIKILALSILLKILTSIFYCQ